MVSRSAQVQTLAGLTDAESECRYQMSNQLTLQACFKAFSITSFSTRFSRLRSANIFNNSSGFNRLNHSDDLMLSKTGCTHSDLLRWQIDYAG
ncbi:hypothetical protein CCE11_25370 [Escherichia coli]|nr:hypothetical protein CCE11_25370 [Escherichia coli]